MKELRAEYLCLSYPPVDVVFPRRHDSQGLKVRVPFGGHLSVVFPPYTQDIELVVEDRHSIVYKSSRSPRALCGKFGCLRPAEAGA
jgi:hypothetical protein